MIRLPLLLLFAATISLGSSVRSEPPPSDSAPAVSQDVDIYSDDADLDFQGRLFLYYGHVLVTDPQMKLKSDRLRAIMEDKENRITTIVAEGSVDLEIHDTNGVSHATSDKAVYSATNNVVVFTGHPHLVNRSGTLDADVVSFDRTRNRMSAHGNVKMEIPAEALRQQSLTGTNRPPAIKSK